MSIKKYLISTIAAGSLLMASSAMATGLTLINKSSIPNSNIIVNCEDASIPAIFNLTVPWNLILKHFLNGHQTGTCIFTNSSGVRLAQGTIDLNAPSNPTSATVTAISLDPKIIAVSPAKETGTDIAITISDASN